MSHEKNIEIQKGDLLKQQSPKNVTKGRMKAPLNLKMVQDIVIIDHFKNLQEAILDTTSHLSRGKFDC